MTKKLPQILAKEILIEYTGNNNQILEWKRRCLSSKIYVLTKTQSDYIIKHHKEKSKVVRNYIELSVSFGKKIMEDYKLDEPLKNIWCEKLLCETDGAYHIYGKYFDIEQLRFFWIPKGAIIPREKKINYEIDYSKYDHRPLLPHQKVAVEKLLANKRFILADDQGTGKTTSAVIAALESNVKKILVICPASLKINWKREFENYTDKSIYIIEGSNFKDADINIVNYDIIKNYYTTDKEKEDQFIFNNSDYDLVIVDEAHYLCNSDAKRTKLMNKFLEDQEFVWLLSGTPMTSRPINYYNLLKIIRSPLTISYKHYVTRYCAGYRFKVGNRKIWNTKGASNLDELRENTKHVVLRRLKTDILDLPEKIISELYLELNDVVYNTEFTKLLKIEKEEIGSDVLSVQLNQIMTMRHHLALKKISYTCEIIDKYLDENKKIIIFTNFTSVVDELHHIYKKKSVVLDGRMSKTERQKSVDKFQQDPDVKIFISNIIAGGVGITLTEAECTIMNDLSFVPSHHAQAEDRSYRYGQKNNVIIYYPIFENTIEKIIYNIVNSKKHIIDTVMGDNIEKTVFKEIMDQIKSGAS